MVKYCKMKPSLPKKDEYDILRIENLRLQHELKTLRDSVDLRLSRFFKKHPALTTILRWTINIINQCLVLTKIGRKKVAATKIECAIKSKKIKTLSICHPKWQGVRSAAEGQSANVIYVPEMHTNDIENIARQVLDHDPDHILINGYWTGYDLLARRIKAINTNVNLYYIHHGSLYQFLEDKTMPDVIARMVQLEVEGVIRKLGFVKSEMDEIFKMLGINAFPLLNRVPFDGNIEAKKLSTSIKTFIPADDHLRKNLHTQLAAACGVKAIQEINIIGPVNLSYLQNTNVDLDRIKVHGYLSRNDVMQIIKSVDFVLYATISECAPMIPLESLAAGTPCITGNNHGLFDGNPLLRKHLVVAAEDNSLEIIRKIKGLFENYDEVVSEIAGFNNDYAAKIRESMETFLSA